MKEESRNRIIIFSFVLTVFVIWLHAGEGLFSIPGQIAVPGFFILSGFLFFFGRPEDTGFLPDWMKVKLKRRVHTLLIPYLLWNFLYFLIYLAAGKAELSEFFSAVLLYGCNPVFWYLQQLILITLVTPLLYLVMKRKSTAVLWLVLIFAMAVLYGRIHSLIDIQFINEDALFYYSLGAFLSLYLYKEETAEQPEEDAAGPEQKPEGDTIGRKMAAGSWKNVLYVSAVFTGFLLLRFTLPEGLMNIGVIGVRAFGALLLWFLLEKLPEVKIRPWMKITFFIYATHYMVIRLVWKLEMGMGLNGNEIANVITCLLMPAICTAAAYGLYLLMKRFTPKFLGLLTGNRGM